MHLSVNNASVHIHHVLCFMCSNRHDGREGVCYMCGDACVLTIFLSTCFLCRPQGQRTVYRLTLVKEWNTEELDAYAELVSVGKPDFIEVKVS